MNSTHVHPDIFPWSLILSHLEKKAKFDTLISVWDQCIKRLKPLEDEEFLLKIAKIFGSILTAIIGKDEAVEKVRALAREKSEKKEALCYHILANVCTTGNFDESNDTLDVPEFTLHIVPPLISDKLAEFVDLPRETRMSRAEIIKKINVYILINKLQNFRDKRIIHPDDKLKTVLMPLDGEQNYTYFNILKYLNHNFSS